MVSGLEAERRCDCVDLRDVSEGTDRSESIDRAGEEFQVAAARPTSGQRSDFFGGRDSLERTG